ncbi:hypothetical protein [Algicola sagamiensis]|uniref:Orf1, orf2, orf3, mstI, orf5, orf6, orf7 genes, partial and n=1 Tax=Alteromonas sp. (strain B-10-31) TaxID=29456 RepID=Q9WWQ3_ALTSP|nr:hypothetical protein [Algicola sagamiensis]BAA81785.1 unnamed protein product [Alteromonas sp. B-10-31]
MQNLSYIPRFVNFQPFKLTWLLILIPNYLISAIDTLSDGTELLTFFNILITMASVLEVSGCLCYILGVRLLNKSFWKLVLILAIVDFIRFFYEGLQAPMISTETGFWLILQVTLTYCCYAMIYLYAYESEGIWEEEK